LTHLPSTGTLGPVSGVAGSMRKLLARTFTSRATDLPHLPTECPLCGVKVVDVGPVSLHFLAIYGPCGVWYTDDELVEMCPLHQMLERAEAGRADEPS